MTRALSDHTKLRSTTLKTSLSEDDPSRTELIRPRVRELPESFLSHHRHHTIFMPHFRKQLLLLLLTSSKVPSYLSISPTSIYLRFSRTQSTQIQSYQAKCIIISLILSPLSSSFAVEIFPQSENMRYCRISSSFKLSRNTTRPPGSRSE